MESIRTPKVENVKLLDRYNTRASPMGTLYLTTTHLIFVSKTSEGNEENEAAGAAKSPAIKKELWLLHMLVQTVEKPVLTTSGSQLRITCNNFQMAVFIIPRVRYDSDY